MYYRKKAKKIQAKYSGKLDSPSYSPKSIVSPKNLSTKFSSSKLLKDGDLSTFQKTKLKSGFDSIKEVPESCYSSINNSCHMGIKKCKRESLANTSKSGYEQQEAEFIGEGQLSTVYKTLSQDGTNTPIVFKAFKVCPYLFYTHYHIV